MMAQYTTKQVARLTLVTQRQLQWWDEQKIIAPTMQQHKRRYQPHDVFGVLLIRELKERGFSLSKAKAIWRTCEAKGFTLPEPASQRWLLTDGKRVEFVADADVVVGFMTQRRTPPFIAVSLLSLMDRISPVEAAPVQKREVELSPIRKTMGRVSWAETLRKERKA